MLNLYHQLFTQRISLVAAIKCMLFSYCWLISCCIQAGLDDYVFESINIKKDLQEWQFRSISPIPSQDRQNDLYVMIDKCIILDQKTKNKVSAIMINMLQKNTDLEFHHMTNNHSLQVDVSNDSLSVDNIIILQADLLRQYIWILDFLEGYKAYESVLIGILTLDKGTEVLRCEIKTISMINHKLDDNGVIIEGRCSELTILTKLLELGACVRYASEKSDTANDVDCEQLPYPYQTKNILPDGVPEFKKSTTAHTKVPVEKTKYACEKWNKEFRFRWNLHEHEKLHTRVKPFACKVCDKAFFYKSNLSSHMIHHAEARPFWCTYCGNGFKSRWGLNEHTKTHTDEKSFICQHCPKTFMSKAHLTVHIRTHDDEKTFVCAEFIY
ncbi:MAG: C2H2-type zinc finger protein [Candidatus Endonucleobacter sp. (ex Gigantidas childressi)]|nr:C2H2-type zinc finger protein [Candidatus Endonucleobacter sp. (ex Gigantidas childressi)]